MAAPAHRLRIIAGRLRGRRLDWTPAAGLRPTPDRVRETLFNWLTPVIEGARCLDAYAGSGALAFEAASRGAARVLCLERSPATAAALRANSERLAAREIEVRCTDALAYLAAQPPEPFDIVWLDPPYDQPALRAQALALLQQRAWLAPAALIYIEGREALAEPPPGFAAQRQSRAGGVHYALLVPDATAIAPAAAGDR